jgi:Family of unknown function (DUF5681)
MPENTVANLEHRFQKGQSGNPAGKPKGARHKTTLLAERLMQDDVEKIVNAVLTAARNGDMMAAIQSNGIIAGRLQKTPANSDRIKRSAIRDGPLGRRRYGLAGTQKGQTERACHEHDELCDGSCCRCARRGDRHGKSFVGRTGCARYHRSKNSGVKSANRCPVSPTRLLRPGLRTG